MLRDEPLPEALGSVGDVLDFLFVDLPVDHVHGRFGLCTRDTWLQACHHRQPAASAIVEIVPRRGHLSLHHQRDHDIGGLTYLYTREAKGADADDGERMAVYADRLVQDRGIPAEPPLPVAVAENRNRMRAGRPIV